MTDYKSPLVGQEVSCVMKGIKSHVLNDADMLKEFIVNVLNKENFHVEDFVLNKFPVQGFTFFALLSESHLAVHTYPEHNAFYMNMYSCRGPKDVEKTFDMIKKKLNPKEVIFFKKDEIPLDKPLLMNYLRSSRISSG
ncbi:S-adenosylmethionine decarboxylase [Candidatus Pacearchaeota archaeon]|nr:S-adenosylmethionine decarboxylase [Candidatus Pacearchaeota archaeon]